jgi:tRNA nucleotidyltransferase (CCA-adding enzyme)
VVIDPTDRNRNVAAAVSKESLRRFMREAREFLKRPSRGLFFREAPSFEERLASISNGRPAFILSMPRPGIVDDVLWGQLKKMVNQMKAHLADFSPVEIFADDSRHLVRLGIVLGHERLNRLMMKKGPPLKMKDHAAHFIASHKRARFIRKSGHIWAEVKRPITDAQDMILSFFDEYSRTKSHLAYPEEMLVLERSGASIKHGNDAKNKGGIKNGRRNTNTMVTKKKSKPKGKKVVKGKGKKKR